MLKADGPAVRNLWMIDCREACVTAAVRTSFILDMSTLELLSCSVACKAGSNCLKDLGPEVMEVLLIVEREKQVLLKQMSEAQM